LLVEFIGIDAVNKVMYIDTLFRIRDAVRRKRPVKCITNSCFLHHDNAPAHRSVLVKDFLVKHNVATLEHPPNFPDLSAADFYPFPPQISASKGRCFCVATDIFKNATEELKRLS
jgi:hypothetical protein